ncbi:hypothetical protein MLD38_003755 [Melastoma candidum]|uniref:Uncharacterized protein n=1 Tax=Melastoma candidum TaxID=119954 RepID=A0ACB9SC31_9MYRT|nr:hypothetical protein MLD38_003755 [Melastoma candidum]
MTTMKILMLPWLAHGHVSPFLELAKRLSRLGFTVFFCSTQASLASVQRSIPEECTSSIRLIQVCLPESPDLPPHLHTTKGLPPHLMSTLKRCFGAAGPALLSDIIADITPDLMIYDGMLWWAPPVAEAYGIPAVVLFPVSATMSSFVVHHFSRRGEKHPLDSIYFDPSFARRIERHALEEIEDGATSMERIKRGLEASSRIALVKSSRELEGKNIDYLWNVMGKKILPVGPLVQDFRTQEDTNNLIGWLDGNRPSSTIFVAFGSEYFLTEKEREEIAHGLELSGVPFIWVINFPEGEETSLDHALPDGFLGRVKGRGVIVEKWAPQARILAHQSVGGFVSHCGWGSVMEGMKFGVPIVAIPMHSDQPLNARVVEDIGVGVEVKRDKEGCLDRGLIAGVIKDVVLGAKGENVRKKAKEIGHGLSNEGEDEKMIEEVGLELFGLRGNID